MRVLVVKTSSMGDILHALPALSDATRHIPDIQFDWVVETAFQEVPSWHPRVATVIPVALRAWRKDWYLALKAGLPQQFISALRAEQYDAVIDAQGLLKSAAISAMARGRKIGFSWRSARESVASLFYQQCIPVPWTLHAVTRIRALFAGYFGYTVDFNQGPVDYGLSIPYWAENPYLHEKYYVFLHGTTWATKHWPEAHWKTLAEKVAAQGYKILLPWGSPAEQQRAQRLAEAISAVTVLPKLSLSQLANILQNAVQVVTVDTGLGHVTAALGVRNVALYGPSATEKTGTFGLQQKQMMADFPCAPCFSKTCHYRPHTELKPACLASIQPDQVLDLCRD